MNQEEILALLQQKFPQLAPADLAPLASDLAAQGPDSHQSQALITKLTEEHLKDFVPAEAFKKEEQPPVVSPALEQLVAAQVRQAVSSLEQRLLRYEDAQSYQQRYSALQEALDSCEDRSFRDQSLKDFRRMQFASAEDFTQYLAQKREDVLQANQLLANQRLSQQQPPLSSKGASLEHVSPSVATFIQLQQNEGKMFKGKEV